MYAPAPHKQGDPLIPGTWIPIQEPTVYVGLGWDFTGKETFDDAVAVALNAVREAKASVAQEQVPYDCYEKLECFTEKLYVNQNENQYGDSQVPV